MRFLGFLLFSFMLSCSDGSSEDTHSVVSETSITTTTAVTTQETGQTTQTSGTTTTAVNLAPTVSILLPSAAGKYGASQQIDFLGEVFDDVDLPESMSIVWESDVDGPLEIDITYGDKGLVAGRASLSEGAHILSLSATDTGGLTTSATVSIMVGSNGAPTCEITDPASGSVIASNSTTIAFFGIALDEETTATDISVEWSSSVDGVLYSGNPNASGETAIKLKTMTLGAHTVSLTAKDSTGNSCTDTIDITFGQSPAVSIDKPSTGDMFSFGNEVQFKVLGKDYEDLPETLDLIWESSIDGVFSTLALDASGEIEIFVFGLSVGFHDVTITATDSDGMSGSDSITLQIL